MKINLTPNIHHQMPIKSLCTNVSGLFNIIRRRRRTNEVGIWWCLFQISNNKHFLKPGLKAGFFLPENLQAKDLKH